MRPLFRAGRVSGCAPLVDDGLLEAMRIAIDARPATGAVMTGIGFYTREMIERLPLSPMLAQKERQAPQRSWSSSAAS